MPDQQPSSAPFMKALRRNVSSYLYLAPNLLLFVCFMVIPVIWTIRLSFFSGGILSGFRFVGIRNYLTIFDDPLFVQSLKITILYLSITMPIVLALSLLLAVLIVDKYVYGKNLFKIALFFPQLAPMVTLATMWVFIIHPEFGLFNIILKAAGAVPPNWLGDARYALVTIILLELWRGTGFYVVVFVAALVGVPADIYDAGLVDGATGLSRFFNITLPLIRPTFTFAFVMATIWGFQVFDSVYVLTRGGPANGTSTVVWYIYQNAFQFEQVGRASTMAVILLVIILLASIVELRFLRSEYEY